MSLPDSIVVCVFRVPPDGAGHTQSLWLSPSILDLIKDVKSLPRKHLHPLGVKTRLQQQQQQQQVYMCMCIHIYVCIYIHVYVRKCVYIYVCVYIHIYIYLCVYVCIEREKERENYIYM